MKDLKKLAARQSQDIKKARHENAIEADLPATVVAPAQVYAYSDHASIRYDVADFAAAVQVMRDFGPNVVTCEHRQAGCLSIQPAGIPSKYKTAEHRADSFAELTLEAYGGNPPTYRQAEVTFWAQNRAGDYLKVSCRLAKTPTDWHPTARIHAGRVVLGSTQPVPLGESFRVKWWREDPGYRYSYFFADAGAWDRWAAHMLATVPA
jgi:hypothetical protein